MPTAVLADYFNHQVRVDRPTGRKIILWAHEVSEKLTKSLIPHRDDARDVVLSDHRMLAEVRVPGDRPPPGSRGKAWGKAQVQGRCVVIQLCQESLARADAIEKAWPFAVRVVPKA